MIYMEKIKDKLHKYNRFIQKNNETYIYIYIFFFFLRIRMKDMYDRYGKKKKDTPKLHTYDRFIQKKNERYLCYIWKK